MAVYHKAQFGYSRDFCGPAGGSAVPELSTRQRSQRYRGRAGESCRRVPAGSPQSTGSASLSVPVPLSLTILHRIPSSCAHALLSETRLHIWISENAVFPCLQPAALTDYPIHLFSSLLNTWSILVANLDYFLLVMIYVFLQSLD